MSDTDPGFKFAFAEAEKGLAEGGIPIGACLVDKDGKILGKGHNMRIQKSSAILHGEMSALEDAGRLPGAAYKGATMYTTLSPCDMCTGACIMYGISRVVLGENKNHKGAEHLLESKGIQVINLDDKNCKTMMAKYIKENPDDWYEDIGKPPP